MVVQDDAVVKERDIGRSDETIALEARSPGVCGERGLMLQGREGASRRTEARCARLFRYRQAPGG